MSLQILNTGPTTGEKFGNALATGLSALAEGKLSQIQQRNQQARLSSGLQALDKKSTPEEIQKLVPFLSQNPQALQEFVKGKLKQQRENDFAENWYAKHGVGQMTPGQEGQNKNIQGQNASPYGQQDFDVTQFGIPRNEQQAIEIGKQIQKERHFQSAQQMKHYDRIVEHNKPFTEDFNKDVRYYDQVDPIITQIEEILNEGKQLSGPLGGLVPQTFQGSATQRLVELSNELVAQEALASSGSKGATDAARNLAAGMKIAPWKSLETQEKNIASFRNKLNKIKQKESVYNNLLEKNNFFEPPNLRQKVEEGLKNYTQSTSQQTPELKEENTEQQQLSKKKESEEESPAGAVIRGGVRTASRIGETVAGTPGDLISAGLGLTSYLTGVTPTYEQVQEYLPISLPTSDQIKNVVSKVSNGYTDAQSGFEETLDNIVGVTAALLSSGGVKGAVKGAQSVLNPRVGKVLTKAANIAFPFSGVNDWKQALKIGIAGEAGAKTAEVLGGGGLAQGLTRIGFMGAAGIPGTRKVVTDLSEAKYAAAAKEGAKKTAIANTVELNKGITNLEKSVGKAAGPNKEMIQEIVSDFKGSIKSASTKGVKGGTTYPSMPINDLVDVKRDANKWLKLGYQPRVPGEKYLPASIRPQIQEIADLANKDILKYGLKNPKFGKEFAQAEELWKGLNVRDQFTNFLNKNVTIENNLNTAFKLGAIGGASVFGSPWALTSVPAAFAAKEAANLYNLVSKSPTALKIYLSTIGNVVNHNKAAALRDFARLGREMQKNRK